MNLTCREKISYILTSLLGLLLMFPAKAMADTIKGDSITIYDSHKTIAGQPLLVIINSYNETKPWVVDIEPVIKAASHHKVKVNIEHLESTRVRNDSLYNITVNTIFSKYREIRPDYVVIIGGLAVTMHDRIREEWGYDIPIVYVGITDRVGQRKDYFTDITNFVDFSTWQPIDSVFHDKNMLFVSQPYFPEKTIDLMVNTMPTLRKIIFLGDEKWTNKYIDQHIKSYIKDKYPELIYHWEVCTYEQSDVINRILSIPHSKTGLLLSTWSYERPGVLGFPVLVTQDYSSIATCPNPVFTLSPMYLSVGAIGGHFYDEEILSRNIRSAIDHMISGDDLDTIPHISVEKGVDILNHDRYIETSHMFGPIPDGVRIINEPPTLWDKYMWVIIIVAIIMIATLVVMHIITKDQRQKALFFRQLDSIVQGMPVAFLTVDLQLDKNRRIISYDFSQSNRRYRDLLEENGLISRKGERYDSVRDILVERIQEALLVPEGQEVTYTKYFPISKKTYEWLFKRDPQLDKCYVYAVDISELADSKRNLASMKGQLEIALLSAHLIPWIWDIPGKRLAYDRIRSHKPGTRSLNDTTESRRGYIDNRRLVRLIHPEDRLLLANTFNEIVNGKRHRWEGYLRIADNTSGAAGHYHNAKITALASETDEYGKVTAITGAILIEQDAEASHIPGDNDVNTSHAADSPEPNRKVLIIEPYDSNYLLYEAVLSKSYEIFRARSLEEAESIIPTISPGLIIINTETDSPDTDELERVVTNIDHAALIMAITSQASTLRALKDTVKKRFTSIMTLPVTPRNLLHEVTRLI